MPQPYTTILAFLILKLKRYTIILEQNILAARSKLIINNNYILEVKNLKKYYKIKNGFLSTEKNFLKAVDGVSFRLKSGETLGIVGESGCGKTTLGNIIAGLISADSGEIIFENNKLFTYGKNKIKNNLTEIQMIFQDPSESIDSLMNIEKIIAEPLAIKKWSKKAKEARVNELMRAVGLDLSLKKRYPHELSGGQKQRVVIARALALSPKLVICDEPVSALDVTTRAQILDLLKSLQKKLNISFIFISHDLSVVKHIANHVAVMYYGKIVEIAAKDVLYKAPQHSYTKKLFAAVPSINNIKSVF